VDSQSRSRCNASPYPEDQATGPSCITRRREGAAGLQTPFRVNVWRSAVAVPTRNDATTGYRFAVTRWWSEMDSNRRSRSFRAQAAASCFGSLSAPIARLNRTGERLASDSDQSDVYVCPA
jgi:hypothetical protein